MSHRTQITLTDAQYERLRRESQRTGVGLAELVRRAVDRAYQPVDPDGLLQALEESFGIWAQRPDADDGAAHVDRLRRGMRERLSRS